MTRILPRFVPLGYPVEHGASPARVLACPPQRAPWTGPPGERVTICEFVYEHCCFTTQYDAFANSENSRFDKYFHDAWSQISDKKLWSNPSLHLIQQVIHKTKQGKTKAILVLPLWDDKLWFHELQDIFVDSLELRGRLSCTLATT